MTGLEALQALCDGKKIRMTYWDEDMFVYLKEDGRVSLSDEYLDTAQDMYKSYARAVIDTYTDILSDDWEVVE
jgi:hypothetical protein